MSSNTITPKTYVEVGLGIYQVRGYGDQFPFNPGDTYVGIDLPRAAGNQALGKQTEVYVTEQDLMGNLINMQIRYDKREVTRTDLQYACMQLTNHLDLRSYADERDISFFPVYANGAKMPLRDNSVEQVLLANVISDFGLTIAEKDALVHEALRVTKPGSFVVALETGALRLAHKYFADRQGLQAEESASDAYGLGQYRAASPMQQNGRIFRIPA